MTASSLLVEPTYAWVPDYSSTLGDEAADLGTLAGLEPDPEQRLILDAIFARNSGKCAFFEVGVVAPRQNLKTGAFKIAALTWLYILDEPLIVWSAHEFDTSQEDHRSLGRIIRDCPYLDRRIKRIYEGNGDESIELMGGQRLLFKARTKVKGRGLTGNKIVLDEAFALQPAHLGSLMPTLSVQPDPQLVYGSSAGHTSSAQLRRIRDRGRGRKSGRLAYLEWAAILGDCEDERCEHEYGAIGCEYDKIEHWAQANTLLGKTRANGTGLTVEYVQAEREAMPPHEFGRERLGIWDAPEGTAAAFGEEGRWERCGGDDRPANLEVGALSVGVSYDLNWGAIGAAGHLDGLMHVKPLAHRSGTGWIVEDAKTLQDEHGGVKVLIDERGPAADLIPDLREADVDLYVMTTGDVLDSCAEFYKAVRAQGLRHGNYPELDAAAAAAVARPVGDRWAWGRKKSTSDISTLETVTFAAWWAAHHQESADPLVAWV